MARNYRPWTEEEARYVREARAAGVQTDQIALALGRTHASVRNFCRDQRIAWNGAAPTPFAPGIEQQYAPPPSTDGPIQQRHDFTVSQEGDRRVLEVPRGSRITTVEQLLERAEIDLTEWEVERAVVNKWETAALVDKQLITEELWQVKVWLKPHSARRWVETKAAILADFRAEMAAPRAALAVAPAIVSPSGDAFCLELDLFDIHLGKLAWRPESGENYDSDRTARAFLAALSDLLARAAPYRIERILLPLGNDFLHYNSTQGLTAAGTPQDRDSRFHKMFRLGRQLASTAIATCAALAPTHVVIIPGNHDTDAMFTLGEVLTAEFADHAAVTIDNRPRSRKYKRYGVTLIGFAHGEDDVPRMPALMATEAKALWAKTRFHEWHIGHLHKKSEKWTVGTDDENGVTIRRMRSLSGTDAWHAKKGFVGTQKGAEAFLYHPEQGPHTQWWHTPDPSLYQ
jgi:hypothetical protein